MKVYKIWHKASNRYMEFFVKNGKKSLWQTKGAAKQALSYRNRRLSDYEIHQFELKEPKVVTGW